MTRAKSRDRWLHLAARHRAWRVEEARPELREACDAEALARRVAGEADHALDDARRDRLALMQGPFAADVLRLRGAHDAQLAARALAGADEVRAASFAADAVRERVRRTMQERDAFEERLDARAERAAADAARVLAREIDELWTVARGAAAHRDKLSSDEETR